MGVPDVVVPYDPDWARRFIERRDDLERALAPLLTTRVEHIGSTSVPGMPAKPIIDMMAGVASLDDAAAAGSALIRLGYRRRPHRVDAVLYVGDAHGVHLTVPGSDLWVERLAFRDALRRSPGLIEQYAELKRQLLRDSGGAVYDSAGKRAFVRRVLAGAGVVLHDGRHDPAAHRPAPRTG